MFMNETDLKFNWKRLLGDKEYRQKLIALICELGESGFFEDCKIRYFDQEAEKVKEIFDKYHFDKEDHPLINNI